MAHDFALAGRRVARPAVRRDFAMTQTAIASAITFLKKLFWKLETSPPKESHRREAERARYYAEDSLCAAAHCETQRTTSAARAIPKTAVTCITLPRTSRDAGGSVEHTARNLFAG